MLQSSWRGQLLYEGFFLDKQKCDEVGKRGLEVTEDGLDSQTDEEENNESDYQNDEVHELVYIPDTKKYFNRYSLATIIIENEFFLQQYE